MAIDDNADQIYDNIREILGPLIGQRCLDVTQNDPDEPPYVMLMFETGYVRFYITDLGFDHDIDNDPRMDKE